MTSSPLRAIPDLSALPRTIDTPRLHLRPYTLADAEAMFAFAKDPALSRQMSWAAHASVDDTRAYLASLADEAATGQPWAITLRDGTYIGSIGLEDMQWQVAAWRVDRAELGYWIGPPHQRRGYLTEAASAVVRFGFETIGLHKITVGCFETNQGSRKVIERLGFRLIGRHEDDVWRDGAWHTQLRYELLASTYGDIATTMPIRVR